MAGVEHLRSADTGVDRQFLFDAEYQLPGNHKPPALLVVG